MLEAESTMAIVAESGRNDNGAVACVASEAFARWLHHQ